MTQDNTKEHFKKLVNVNKIQINTLLLINNRNILPYLCDDIIKHIISFMYYNKTIRCGYLFETQSLRYHPFQNITFMPSCNWYQSDIYYKNKIIHSFVNDMIQKYEIKLKDSKKYPYSDIIINNEIITTIKYLYYFDIIIHYMNGDEEFIQYIQYSICI